MAKNYRFDAMRLIEKRKSIKISQIKHANHMSFNLTSVRCSFVVKSFVIGKRHTGNVAVNGGELCVRRGFMKLKQKVMFTMI